MRASSGSSGVLPAALARASSMNAVKKSPSFCSAEPLALFADFDAPSTIARSCSCVRSMAS